MRIFVGFFDVDACRRSDNRPIVSQRSWVGLVTMTVAFYMPVKLIIKLEMWANAQRDGRPAEYRWRPLFNAAKFG